mmetsp:Transcript_16819/g.16818  ORF Transcript_16819/g.16818 Transcript_16819/m.16818 type:complete len:105 (+) Transcript_16819:346-660(+)
MPMVVAVSLAASIVIHSVVVTCCVCCFSKWFLHSSVILNMFYVMTATDADGDADACIIVLKYIGSRNVTWDESRSVTNTVVDGLCLTYRMFVPVTLTPSFNHPV